MSPDSFLDSGLIEIPAEVRQAALTLELFFKMQGAENWQLMGVCSRSYAYKYESLTAFTKGLLKGMEQRNEDEKNKFLRQ